MLRTNQSNAAKAKEKLVEGCVSKHSTESSITGNRHLLYEPYRPKHTAAELVENTISVESAEGVVEAYS